MARLTPEQIITDLKAKKTEASRIKSNIARLEKTATTKSEQLEKVVTDTKASVSADKSAVATIHQDAKREYNLFKRSYDAATGKTTGVEAKHSKIKQLADEAADNAKIAEREAANAETKLEKISAHLARARTDKNAIAAINNTAEEIRENLLETYNITLDTTMAGTFKERRDALKRRVLGWEIAYFVSIAIVVTGLVIALNNNLDSFYDVLTERVVFVTPLIFVSFVINKQFTHERKLFEEYAFKTASAQSLRGYTILLNEQFTDKGMKDKILDFVITTMGGIFDREPLTQNSTTLQVIFGNRLAKAEAKLADTVNKATKEATQEVVDKLESAAPKATNTTGA